MRFSKRRPKVAGWYWVRTNKTADTIEKVSETNGNLTMTRMGGGAETLALSHWIEYYEEDNLQFAGPLFQPKDM